MTATNGAPASESLSSERVMHTIMAAEGLSPAVKAAIIELYRVGLARADGQNDGPAVEAARSAVTAYLANRPAVPLDSDVEAVAWDSPAAAPPRPWLIPHWLPLGRLAVLAGSGGTGKSMLALQLAAAVVSTTGLWLPADEAPTEGEPVLGLRLAPTLRAEVAVYASYEDEADELLRRWQRVRAGQPDLAAGDRLRYANLRRAGEPLWEPDASEGYHPAAPGAPTTAGRRLLDFTADVGARLLVLDTAVAAYSGNENDNANVRRFLLWLDSWSERVSCTVVLVHHTAKGGGTGPRGASDFTNGARAVLSLGYAAPEADAPDQPYLSLDKANYAQRGALPMLKGHIEGGRRGRVGGDYGGRWLTWTEGGYLATAADEDGRGYEQTGLGV